tara:strand:+ start:4717 stop:4935 length:219 start_codon:yes stop_codon:yes gene_type:complete
MISRFFKELIKFYVDRLMNWLRVRKLKLELDNEIKKYHEELDKEVKKPEIREVGKFGEDGWSISIGDVDKDE